MNIGGIEIGRVNERVLYSAMCMCVCMYICIHIYIYIYMCVCVCVCVCLRVCMRECVNLCICVCIYVHPYVRTISISVHELILKSSGSCGSFCVCMRECSHSDLRIVIRLMSCVVQHLIVVKLRICTNGRVTVVIRCLIRDILIHQRRIVRHNVLWGTWMGVKICPTF